MTKRLLVFAIIYSFISFGLLQSIPKGEHGNFLAIPILILFWAVAAVPLTIIYQKAKAKSKTKWNWLIIFFCTPLPTLMFAYGWYKWTMHQQFLDNQSTSRYYTQNGYCIKEVDYIYLKKKEFWSNVDSPNNEYRIDSTVTFNDETNKYETERYVDWERLKGDREIAKCQPKNK